MVETQKYGQERIKNNRFPAIFEHYTTKKESKLKALSSCIMSRRNYCLNYILNI